jgi:acetolactate synthase-1/2/3 large subunit
VHVSVPLDVMRSVVSSAGPAYNLISLLARPAWKDESALATMVELLLAARKPIFVLGGGCQDAAGLILRAAMMVGARVVTTPDGKGLISPFHPTYDGVVSFAGHVSAERTLRDPEVDLMITIGNLLSEWSSNNW